MKVIRRVLAGGILMETSVPAAGLFLVAILIGLISFLRYAFSYAILGLDEFVIIVGLYVYFLGSACASRDEVQIRVSIVDQVSMPPQVRFIINLTMSFIAFAVCGVFLYYAITYSLWTLEANLIITPLMWPRLTIGAALIAGLSLMTVHHLAHSIRYLRKGAT